MAQPSTVRNVGFIALGALLLGVMWIAFATYRSDPAGKGHLFLFAIEHHIEIMASMALVAVVFGFAMAQFYEARLRKSEEASSSIMDTVLLFLGKDERGIVKFLMEHGGETTQAEISRLPGMTRVKAHRSLQKMQEKQLLDVIPHGKARRVKLKEHVHNALRR